MANRVVSTRRIEVLARRDVSFIYLSGGQRPVYRTLARFRRRNARAIKKLFRNTVLLCARLGMVKLGHIALDGTKLKANASKYKAMSYGRMKQEEERLEGEIDELMQQAEAADTEEDREFGVDNTGYNLPEELQRREERLAKIGLRPSAGILESSSVALVNSPSKTSKFLFSSDVFGLADTQLRTWLRRVSSSSDTFCFKERSSSPPARRC